MKFMITAYDGTDGDALSRRMNTRPRHLENLAKEMEKGHVICAGGILNDAGKPAGSLLIMDYDSREELDEYLANEPYVLENVWQDIKAEPFNVVILNNEKVGK